MSLAARIFLVAVAALAAPTAAVRAADYDEAVSGDVSSDPGAPLAWTLGPGANVLTGTAGGDFFEGQSDFDLVAFTVPPGHQLDSITVNHYENIDEFSMSFLGLQAGDRWLDNLGWDIQGLWLLGWMHLRFGIEGHDVLEEMKAHSDSPDFHLPMPAGVYTLLIEDVDFVMSYSLQFNVSPVPEPPALTLLPIAAALLVIRRRPPRPR